jgi:carboxypeptidase Q
MKQRLSFLVSALAFTAFSLQGQTNSPSIEEAYRETAAKLITAATNSDFAHQRLAKLCDTFGNRLSGSTNLENAIDWVLAEMKKDGLANVRGEPAMVTHWVRGAESVELLSPTRRSLKMLGLGGSIATPAEGITAEVLVVSNFDDLHRRAAEAKGKIVVFNQPFTRYSETTVLRYKGAIEASKVGAVASMIRSVTPYSMQMPHTGVMRYDTNIAPAIPHCAITIEDAEFLQRAQDRGEKCVVKIKMSAQELPDAPSRNVVAEIVGREKPEEIVVLGGHIDSWDVGQGAMDDGGGCIAAWQAVNLMKKLGLQPRRTIRVVLWTNEENGGKGARAYHEQHLKEMPKHVLAMECDDGTFKPTGFAFSGGQKASDAILDICQLLKPINANQLLWGAGGADISKMQPDGVPIMDLADDMSRYFWYHHTEADTVDKVDSHELNLCTATMAVMAYVVADMPETLPR